MVPRLGLSILILVLIQLIIWLLFILKDVLVIDFNQILIHHLLFILFLIDVNLPSHLNFEHIRNQVWEVFFFGLDEKGLDIFPDIHRVILVFSIFLHWLYNSVTTLIIFTFLIFFPIIFSGQNSEKVIIIAVFFQFLQEDDTSRTALLLWFSATHVVLDILPITSILQKEVCPSLMLFLSPSRGRHRSLVRLPRWSHTLTYFFERAAFNYVEYLVCAMAPASVFIPSCLTFALPIRWHNKMPLPFLLIHRKRHRFLPLLDLSFKFNPFLLTLNLFLITVIIHPFKPPCLERYEYQPFLLLPTP